MANLVARGEIMGAHITVDLGFGDSAKGATIDYLSHLHPNNVTVRYSGGPQAAHNVVQPDGRHHTFRQIGAGSFVPTSKTFLSKYMLVNPTSLLFEWDELQDLNVDLTGRVYVSENAQVILPWYATMTQIRELIRENKVHGSTGEGISEARRNALNDKEVLYIRDLNSDDIYEKLDSLYHQTWNDLDKELTNSNFGFGTYRKVKDLVDNAFPYENLSKLITDYEYFSEKVQIVADYKLKELASTNTLLFEAAQGILLDEYYGFHPYNTWTNTTTENALKLLSDINYTDKITTYGLLRAYQTRHGAGPMPTQSTNLDYITEAHNRTEQWSGEFRNGYLDTILLNYALELNPVDYLVVSNLDQINEYITVSTYDNATALNVPTQDLDMTNTKLLMDVKSTTQVVHNSESEFLDYLENALNTPICLVSHGQTHLDRKPTSHYV